MLSCCGECVFASVFACGRVHVFLCASVRPLLVSESVCGCVCVCVSTRACFKNSFIMKT